MMLIFADRGIQSGWSADSIQSTLEGIEEKFEKCNDKLASVSVGPCSYQFQADKIERMTQDLQLLQSYAGSAPDYVWETLDNPLYVDFKNNATESLSQIILDDFYTDNTIGMEEHFTVSQKGAVYSQKRVKETLTFSDFLGLPAVEHEDSMVTLENVETVNEFASLFRKDYDKMKEADIETCIRNYLTSGEFNHEAYHPALDFLSGLLDITIVKPVIEFFTGTDLITGERLTEAQKYQKMAGAIVDMFTFGQGLVAMKGAGLVGKELCKAFGKTMLVEVASSASAYTVGYGVEAMGLPPQIAWMLGAATGCIVSTAGMNLVFRNPKTGVVRECSLEEITSLEKLDASEIDIAKLGKEVPTDDLELYMRYQKEGSIEHFTDSEKKTISRIETMGITGDECEEILRARGREVNRPPIEEPEAVLPPRNESEGKGVAGERLIPGVEGVVTGGDSTKLGKNMMESMGLPRGTNWTGHQAQHIIPAEMANHPVLQRIGMDLDDASNGLFLRTPADDVSAMSRHRGYHSTYNEFVKTQFDAMDISQSVDVLQKQVYDLQQNLKYLQQSGLPLYPSQGATVDLWQRSLERIQ